MRIVLDTKVIVSALLFGGKPRRILEGDIRGEIELLLSEPIVEELREVLQRPKFGLPSVLVQTIISELASVGVLVKPTVSINKIRHDPADNRILECATEGHAEYIVSGDRDP